MGCCNGVQGTGRWKLQAAFPYLPRSHGLCMRSARTLRLRRNALTSPVLTAAAGRSLDACMIRPGLTPPPRL
jgi:hypothetical protein